MNQTASRKLYLHNGELGRRIAARLDQITLHKVREIGFANAVANAARVSKGKSIVDLNIPSANDSALVIAAGPSLHRTGPEKYIDKTTYKGVLVATESSLSWCLKRGIVPDLVVTLDPHASRIVRWFGDPTFNETKRRSDDYFARQDQDPGFRDEMKHNQGLVELVNQFGSKIKIAISTSASTAVVDRAYEAGMDVYWWNPMYDDYDIKDSLTRKVHKMNGLPCVNAGGNVGSACWVFAHAVLKKKKVGLLGMDFGYYPDTPFTQTQYYKEILSLVGEGHLDEIYMPIHNPFTNVTYYTDPAYLWYRDGFLEMVQQAGTETHNCTGGGILFGPGIVWTPLDVFMNENKGG